MTEPRIQIPDLLVSVRNASEAAAALAGDCDVIDVKEPSRGPLGMADVATIAAIIEQVRAVRHQVPVSIALGEAADWPPQRQIPAIPTGIKFLKLGTACLAAGSDGHSQFAAIQRQFEVNFIAERADNGTHSNVIASEPCWIAVAYADFGLARAPAPEGIFELALECGCAGLLIDTFTKNDKRLLDWLDADRLAALRDRCRTAGLTFALAGRLQATDLPRLLPMAPDLIGIRSAACRENQRNGPVDCDAVRAFCNVLKANAWGRGAVHSVESSTIR